MQGNNFHTCIWTLLTHLWVSFVHRGCLGRSGWNGRFQHVWVLYSNKVASQTYVECALEPRLWSFIWHVELMLLACKWALYGPGALCTPGTFTLHWACTLALCVLWAVFHAHWPRMGQCLSTLVGLVWCLSSLIGSVHRSGRDIWSTTVDLVCVDVESELKSCS